ncbi:hypothetical protein FRC07_001453 [Ceratobasidium sp. 392]|nr:hypothetical protein FRC07_001453 [Ceratobasidium sp. 392]
MAICPHCGKTNLSDRTIRDHMKTYREEVGAYFDLVNEAEDVELDFGSDDSGPALGDNEQNPHDAPDAPQILNDEPMALDNDPPAPNDPRGDPPPDHDGPPFGAAPDNEDDFDIIDLDALIAREGEDIQMGGVDMNLDDEDDLFVPPPEIPAGPPPVYVRRNPVTIEDWDSDVEALDDIEMPFDDDIEIPPNNDVPAADGEVNPEFHEDDRQRGLDPDEEPDMEDVELWEFLRQHLGDLAEEEWVDIFYRHLTPRDRKTLSFLAARLRTHFSRATYEDLRQHACEELGLPSDFVAWRRLKILSNNLETRSYDCCVNSCICYLGKYKDLRSCPECNSLRFSAGDKPRRTFHYTPLIPQLIGLFQNRDSIEKMQHRVRHEAYRAANPGKLSDVFDGELYRTLRTKKVFQERNYKFFDNPTDIALGLGTDGFNLFKRRHKGESTAWPLILVNYNLHSSIRYRLHNIICVGVIPGPTECKDMNSFLVPLIEELLELAAGIETSRVALPDEVVDGAGLNFDLHAFLILLFGDIPALSKLLMLKGHTAITPCRACLIRSTPCQLATTIHHYFPLTPPDYDVVPPEALIPRTHQSYMRTYNQLDREERPAARAALAQGTGINGRTILAELGSIDLASCAPYELMHLIFENLVPNMVMLWKNEFKWIKDPEVYHIGKDIWKKIGQLTAEATRTIPTQFVGTLPDIDRDMHLYKAEAYAFWFVHLAPIVLNGRLNRVYYRHFLDMREIVIWCLQLEISNKDVDRLEQKVNKWVQDYESTIGFPSLLNRIRPYDCMDNFIRRRAQMQIVAIVHNMPELVRPVTNLTLQHGELISTKETIYEDYKDYILGQPVKRILRVADDLKRRFTRYFGVAEGPLPGEGPPLTYEELVENIDWNTLVRYGKFRIASMGDRIRTAGLIRANNTARDNSFIRYEALPDRNARRPRAPYQGQRRVYYARVLDVYYVEYIRDHEANTRGKYLLAMVQDCNTEGVDAAKPENPIVTYNRLDSAELIHLGAVHAAVGRIRVGGRATWAIVDRTRGARTQFNDDAGVADPDID